MQRHVKRLLYGAVGISAFVLGVVGIFLPVLPTVPFMLVALWAFSNSSQRLHDAIYHHPRFGRAVREWKRHGAIPPGSKAVALTAMSLSGAWLLLFSGASAWLQVPALAFIGYGAWFVLTRPTLHREPGKWRKLRPDSDPDPDP